MLAEIGRGFSDSCVYKEAIYPKIVHLLNMAAVPVISNVTVEIVSTTLIIICLHVPLRFDII
jgi:hypothetical protein